MFSHLNMICESMTRLVKEDVHFQCQPAAIKVLSYVCQFTINFSLFIMIYIKTYKTLRGRDL
jgi:hypothetical protein